MDAIRAAWEASRWQFAPDYTYDQFADAVSDWECWPIEVGGEMAGAILVKGCEIHACIKPDYFRRWATPGLYRKVLRRLRECGKLTTHVRDGHDAGHEFVARFGFKVAGLRGDVMIYEMRC